MARMSAPCSRALKSQTSKGQTLYQHHRTVRHDHRSPRDHYPVSLPCDHPNRPLHWSTKMATSPPMLRTPSTLSPSPSPHRLHQTLLPIHLPTPSSLASRVHRYPATRPRVTLVSKFLSIFSHASSPLPLLETPTGRSRTRRLFKSGS